MDLSQYSIVRRNNDVTPFNKVKITEAITKAFLEEPSDYVGKDLSFIEKITDEVVLSVIKRNPTALSFHIEVIQDQVELVLMRSGYVDIANRYMHYRIKRAEERAALANKRLSKEINMKTATGLEPLDVAEIEEKIKEAARGLKNIDQEELINESISEMYEGITEPEIQTSLYMAASAKIEYAPEYSKVSARLLLNYLKTEIFGSAVSQKEMHDLYLSHLPAMLERGVRARLLNPVLTGGRFDLERLAQEIKPERDLDFEYLGLQTLYDRYFVHINNRRIEMPQSFFMRVAMGLAIEEDNPTERAIEFYNVLSQFDFMTSTPTLFNSGGMRSQLSSCYLTTVGDSLPEIFDAYKENALLSKYAGGLGNDWTNVRSMGAYIAGTNGNSQGVVPFLKIVNDTAVAVNQCFPGTTEVLTGTGQLKPIKTLKEKELVLGRDGKFHEITEVHEYDYQKEALLQLRPADRAPQEAIAVTTGHPFWAVRNPDNKTPAEIIAALTAEEMLMEWVPAKDLRPNDYLGSPCGLDVRDSALSELDCYDYGKRLAEDLEPGRAGAKNLTGMVKFLKGAIVRHGRPARYIEEKYSFLPLAKTKKLLEGIFGAENKFTAQDARLVSELRVQLLRAGEATAQVSYDEATQHWTLHRTPATAGMPANWFAHNDFVFSRLEEVLDYHDTPEHLYDLKVADVESYWVDGALVHNGGKRKGAVCSYLETWHYDIEEYLELRKNTGDDRRRTHDMNTANWVPDLFIMRVLEEGPWTLFSPAEVPDLHGCYGQVFREKYLKYEKLAEAGKIKNFKQVDAKTLWRKMLTMLFETGHPWITFKDPCNIRSPQQHVGVVNCSNLCTEITLNTNKEEIAVCNIGSVNLARHINDKRLDHAKLHKTITTAMRMLDNVIDINFYAVDKAERSNKRHRPVGLGMMGFQDCLYKLGISYDSEDAVKFADMSTEAVAYMAYWASSELARERGKYKTYEGSLWSKGILPKDTLKLLAKARGDHPEESSSFGFAQAELTGEHLKIDMSETMDWKSLREKIKKDGMRNSNCLAIAPTATIANIVGVTASIEPTFQNIYAKSNLSGEFTVVNNYIIEELRELNLWDPGYARPAKVL